MTSTPEQVIAKIREALEGDHERLCQGREYTCTCGHDDAVHQALTAALQSAADTPAPQPNVKVNPFEGAAKGETTFKFNDDGTFEFSDPRDAPMTAFLWRVADAPAFSLPRLRTEALYLLGVLKNHDAPPTYEKKVLVKYAFCCPGSVLYCDCVNKNHGTAVMGESEAGGDYPIVGPAPEPMDAGISPLSPFKAKEE